MARLNYLIESDDELPGLSEILGFPMGVRTKTPPDSTKMEISSRHAPRRAVARNDTASSTHESGLRGDAAKRYRGEKRTSKQGPLGSLKHESFSDSESTVRQTTTFAGPDTVRSIPRRKAKASVDYSNFVSRFSEASISISEDDDSLTDLSGFVVADSASDEDVLPAKSPRIGKVNKSTKKCAEKRAVSSPKQLSIESYESSGLIDLTSPNPKKKRAAIVCPESASRRVSSPRASESIAPNRAYFDLDEPFAKLRFSPRRSKSPYKSKEDARPATPPLSPAKSSLQSLSKKHRIPPSPHRPSIDAFWSQDVINDWNEQYSPTKPLKSPSKSRLYSVHEDEDGLSPSESRRKNPAKNPAKSPIKKDKKVIEQRKGFNDRKRSLATSFLAEVDQIIAQGKVAALAESTGGIKVIWSKKLASTAGRANWRREAVRSKSDDGIVSTTTHRHHASIELAEKVIDDEDRLINVIAHEYCHLANFMISGVKDNPHGKEFKEWAQKCTKAFADRNVNVTTKHAYEIAYKYIWACTSPTCGLYYKRHSKSIDPARHSCGSCKSKLVQIQPVPRKGQGEGKRSEYQGFVKREQARVRLENPAAGFGEIMAILGKEFRESKKAVVVEEVEDVDDGFDSVARKLNFLTLRS